MWAVTIDQPGSPATLGWSATAGPGAGSGRGADRRRSERGEPRRPAAGRRPLPAAARGVADPRHGVLRGGRRARAPGSSTGRSATEVCALLAGGGYAQRVAVPAGQVLPVPDGVDLDQAGGLPEVTCTVWSNLVMTAGLSARQTVLIHGGRSGIGTMAIQVARQEGATVAVTASRRRRLDACRELGARPGDQLHRAGLRRGDAGRHRRSGRRHHPRRDRGEVPAAQRRPRSPTAVGW